MTINKWGAAAVAAALFVAGAATTYQWRSAPGADPRHANPQPSAASPAPDLAPGGTGVIQIAPELMQRSGIVVDAATATTVNGGLRLPGTVQPNAYRKVSVTPFAGGRVMRVPVELGQAVARGTTIAEIYSPDVASARARYLAAKADTAAAEAKLRRTERLATLGSASQQELEEIHAEHVRHITDVREAAARLRLLGLDPSTIDENADGGSTLRVVAPEPGVIIDRPATIGMTADAATVLATIASLSPVWVMADAYDRDVAGLADGAQAVVTSDAYPGVDWRGRVTYISPEVRPETRTTQVRVEVANPEGRLRFGMFVTVTVAAKGVTAAVSVPREAVQTVGAAQVVFVPDGAAGAFRERQVTVGETSGDRVTITSGLSAGEPVVTRGSFALRAEAERLGIRPAPTAAAEPPAASPQEASVTVTAAGFEPNMLTLEAGRPARVTVTRKTAQTCAMEVELPDYGIKRPLPLNQPVVVEFTPRQGEARFQCGMGMLTGRLIVR